MIGTALIFRVRTLKTICLKARTTKAVPSQSLSDKSVLLRQTRGGAEEGQKAVQLDLATKAIEAKQAIAKESSVVLLPDGGTDAASMVAQAMTIISTLNTNKGS